MGFTWSVRELRVLEDPNFIDRLGHYIHGQQSNGYRFAMDVMGYKAMYYSKEFEDLVKSESTISTLKTEVQQVCRGAFSKLGAESWEVSFKAEALIRNELDPNTHLPIGEIDYATDLIYSNTILYSVSENGDVLFTDWLKTHGLIGKSDFSKKVFSQPDAEFTMPLQINTAL